MTTWIRQCAHCGNTTPHNLVTSDSLLKAFDTVDGEVIPESFKYVLVSCSTCKDVSLLGGFELELPQSTRIYPVLYPHSPDLGNAVPDQIRRVYLEAARIRATAPNAFAGQIRRALEFLCQDQDAKGRNLQAQLASLVSQGIIPPTLADMTTLMRLLGNIGVHASEDEVDPIDAELIDDFFRSIVEYVYVAPGKVSNLQLRLAHRGKRREAATKESSEE